MRMSSGFWNWSEDGKASLNMEAVVQNTICNMVRIEEEATLNVVVDFLLARGYTVTEPEGGHDA